MTASPRTTIGYLHIGDPLGGLARYSRMLAGEIRNQDDIDVIEATVQLRGSFIRDLRALFRAARKLGVTDLLHLQYNAKVWGGARRQFLNLSLFLVAVRRPVVVSVHDVYDGAETTFGEAATDPVVGAARRKRTSVARQRRALRLLARNAKAVLVCTGEEASRLRAQVSTLNPVIVPHFVESQALEIGRESAKRSLGFQNRTILTVLGYILPRKGYELVLEAVARLDDRVHVVFAGGSVAGQESYLAGLQDRAAALGISHRVHVTGYLSDSELAVYASATDVALCPFRRLSASGSLATWISFRKPIIASNHPQISELNGLSPGSIDVFDPYDSAALADAINSVLKCNVDERRSRVAVLVQRLNLSVVSRQHLTLFREILEEVAQ